MSRARHCPALLVTAPASGQGKTTVTAALARRHRALGRRVRVFKTGPDFLDPTLLERASEGPVYQLDLFMGGEAHCRQLLYEAARDADLILVEGVMGLHDGQPSSADLAAAFGLPVVAVIDGRAMAQTFGALALGLAAYRPGLILAGVIANRVAGERHTGLLRDSLPPGIAWLGALPRDERLQLPDRHLGLKPAHEIADLDQRLERAAAALGEAGDFLPPPVSFAAAEPAPLPAPLKGARIAVARDPAFAFLYRANLDTLRALGAEITFFSPLADEPPAGDAVYLPGGYPELHLDALSGNKTVARALRAHHAAGRPIVAECGGLLYLLETLTGQDGHRAPMLGLVPGHAVVQDRLAGLGLHALDLPEGELRGHSFHYSHLETGLTPAAHTRPHGPRVRPEPVFRDGRLFASYLHLYLPSNPAAGARLFQP